MTTKAATIRQEQSDALDKLREFCPPGTTVYTVLRHVSRSGMTRHIDAYVMTDGDPQWLSGYIARAGLYRRVSGGDSLVVGGTGMDMGFAVVYDLSRTLYPDGFDCIGEAQNGDHWTRGCPANDHSNDRGVSDYSPTRRHNDGGYALRQRWI